jgi:hypothetical protein
MVSLPRNHPFIVAVKKLELLEANYGLTDEIMEERIRLKREYPEYFKLYMRAKRNKQEEKAQKEKIEKQIQMRERQGFESISYLKNKIEQEKKKNRAGKESVKKKK